jgi:hypothetical protein
MAVNGEDASACAKRLSNTVETGGSARVEI